MMTSTSHVAALVTAVVGSIAALGGAAFVVSGIHTLQTRDLGLGGVGLTIGLILLAALVVLPGILCLALVWFIYHSRRWAIKAVLSIALFHLLLTLFGGFTALSSSGPRGRAFFLILVVTAMQIVQIYCLARSFPANSREPRARGFEPIMNPPAATGDTSRLQVRRCD
jgi:hypothetical protein